MSGKGTPWEVDPIPPPRRPEITVGEAHRRLWKRMMATPRPRPSPTCHVCRRRTTIRREYLKVGPVEFLVRLFRLQLEDPDPKTSRQLLPYARASAGSLKRGNDATYLEHWGLIKSPKRGVFRLTPLGFDFVVGRRRVPRWVDLYCAQDRLAWSKEEVSIRQVLGKRRALLDKLYALPEIRDIRRKILEKRRREKRVRARKGRP